MLQKVNNWATFEGSVKEGSWKADNVYGTSEFDALENT